MSIHLDIFDDQWSSAKGDIKYLRWHVTLKKHIFQGLSLFMSGRSSWYITTFPSFVSINIVVVGITMFLACHLIKQDHIIKGSDEYNDRRLSR